MKTRQKVIFILGTTDTLNKHARIELASNGKQEEFITCNNFQLLIYAGRWDKRSRDFRQHAITSN